MLRDDHEGWQGGLIHNRADFSGIGWPVVRKTEELFHFFRDFEKPRTVQFWERLVVDASRCLSQAHIYPPLTNNGPSRAFGACLMQLYGGLAPNARQNARQGEIVAKTVSSTHNRMSNSASQDFEHAAIEPQSPAAPGKVTGVVVRAVVATSARNHF